MFFQWGLNAQIYFDEKTFEIKSIVLHLEKKFEFTSDKNSLRTIKKILKRNVMLMGFHDEFRAIKTIGKGSTSTVIN